MKTVEELCEEWEEWERIPVMIDAEMAEMLLSHCRLQFNRLTGLLQNNVLTSESPLLVEALVQEMLLWCKLELSCLRALNFGAYSEPEENERAQNDVKSRIQSIFHLFED